MSEDLEIIFDLAKDSMSNAISHLEKKLLNIRAGKANPNMLTNVFVDYYGTSTPISQVANVNTPDGRTLIIQPWDKSMFCLLYTSPSPRDATLSRMPSSA